MPNDPAELLREAYRALDDPKFDSALAALLSERDELAERVKDLDRGFRHALTCVDKVFQVGGQAEEPLLPDFLPLGTSKFDGVVTLAEAYIAALARAEAAERELNKWRDGTLGYSTER